MTTLVILTTLNYMEVLKMAYTEGLKFSIDQRKRTTLAVFKPHTIYKKASATRKSNN
jgi:hypothetical protein